MCDGCALGTSGLKDWTLTGTHLCMVRLELMRLNTAPALDPSALRDIPTLAGTTSAGLRARGRLPEPMLRRQGEQGFQVVSWDQALDRLAEELRRVDPARAAFFMTSRGITNEVSYAAQKAARFLGTNHVDNAARLCHAACDHRDEGRARARSVDLQLHRLARRRSHRLLRVQRGQQPAGHHQVPALREATRGTGGGGQHVPRAGHGA